MEINAYTISGTSFFLDVVCMIACARANDIQLLADFQRILKSVFFPKTRWIFHIFHLILNISVLLHPFSAPLRRHGGHGGTYKILHSPVRDCPQQGGTTCLISRASIL